MFEASSLVHCIIFFGLTALADCCQFIEVAYNKGLRVRFTDESSAKLLDTR